MIRVKSRKPRTVSRPSKVIVDNDKMAVVEFIYGNVWVRHMIFKAKGSVKKGHKHNFDHIHFVAHGSVEVFELGEHGEKKSLGIYKAGEFLRVPAGMAHTVVAQEDNTIAYCVQAVRDASGLVTEDNLDFKNTRL